MEALIPAAKVLLYVIASYLALAGLVGLGVVLLFGLLVWTSR